MKLDNFFAELKQRNGVRTAGLYVRFQARFKMPAAGEKNAPHE